MGRVVRITRTSSDSVEPACDNAHPNVTTKCMAADNCVRVGLCLRVCVRVRAFVHARTRLHEVSACGGHPLAHNRTQAGSVMPTPVVSSTVCSLTSVHMCLSVRVCVYVCARECTHLLYRRLSVVWRVCQATQQEHVLCCAAQLLAV